MEPTPQLNADPATRPVEGLERLWSLLPPPALYWPALAVALESVCASMFVSFFLLQKGCRKVDAQGWHKITMSEITRRTGLKRSEQETARRALIEKGLLEEKKRDVPATLQYRFDVPAFIRLLEQMQADGLMPAPKPARLVNFPGLHGRMQDIFDAHYEDHSKMAFSWDPASKGGREHEALKKFEQYFEERARKKNVTPEEMPDVILQSWDSFLSLLLPYHRSKWFTPSKLFENINVVVGDIAGHAKTVASKTKAQQPRSSVEDYAA